jgi:hypothetical protein
VSTNAPFLFVSHVHEDRPAAIEVVAALERRGLPCWIAPRDVEPGKPYDDEIADALEKCRAMLLIFSDRCNDNQYIRREVTVAGENRKPIIPFRIEDARPRKALQVRLSDLNWIDGFVSRERAINEVAKVFDTVKPETRPAPASEVEEADSTPAPAKSKYEPASADFKYQRDEKPPRRRPRWGQILIVGAVAMGLSMALAVIYLFLPAILMRTWIGSVLIIGAAGLGLMALTIICLALVAIMRDLLWGQT